MLLHWPFRRKISFAGSVFFTLFLALGLLTAQSVLAAEQPGDPAPAEGDACMEPDVSPWHTHTLSDGETYDVGTSKKNTTVYIDDPGTYYLKGKSTYCRVVIRSGGVNLYLKDGLNLDPGIYAYVGSSTAAITIEDQGGTVRLISEKNADIYFGGYYYCPAIRKDNHKTKLIFETEDPANPGTITAYRSMVAHSAAIGSVYELVWQGYHTGNVEFKSGKIIASGGNNAAAIGGGSGCHTVSNYVFSGADVTATGFGCGAGIGGGLNGSVDNIVISGGKVTATAEDHGAGIGSGQDNGTSGITCGTIRITGGEVTATSTYGSAIGSAQKGTTEHIIISGGTVRAIAKEGYGTAIGATAANSNGRCARIDISGGTIYAEGSSDGGTAIGSADSGHSGNTTINISGGRITAISHGGFSIGGGGKGTPVQKGHCYINISGGTIQCGPVLESKMIGSKFDMTTVITGGSINASIQGIPTDGKENPVTKLFLKLHGASEGTRVTDAVTTELPAGYSWNDVYTLDETDDYSLVYPWLPDDSDVTQVTAGNIRYYGSIEPKTTEGDYYPGTQLTLDANTSEPGSLNGSAGALKGETKAENIVDAVRPGYKAAGYALSKESSEPVLKSDGSFAPNISGYTDDKGQWLKAGGSATFYALWTSGSFTVNFDGNRPATASTAITGSMAAQAFTYGQTRALTANAYTLTGYTFTGWNTRADGKGTAVTDGADGSKLCAVDQGKVTLYAQWSPITYYVKFDGNGAGSGSMNRQRFTFDQSQALTKNAFKKDGQVFAGWVRLPAIGTHYSDGQVVENLADVQDAEVTLQAVWLTQTRVALKITLDGTPVAGCDILFKDRSGAGYKPSMSYSGGVYTYDGTEFPPGTYTVVINNCDTGRTITVTGTGVDIFDYYTVSALGGDHIPANAVSCNPANAANAVIFGDTEGWPVNSSFLVSVDSDKIDKGYTFNQWQSPAVDPEFTGGTSAKSNPAKIAINGKTKLQAEARPVGYFIGFEPNVPEGASTGITGQMEDQAFTFDTANALVPCAYELEGYLFTGWNTKPDLSGSHLADGATVKNLTDIENATVKLYAEWQPITYRVVFNSNYGTGEMADQEMTFDTPVKLSKNLFTREDRHFIGWNTNPAGTAQSFADEEQVANLTSSQGAAVTLYAQWARDTYFIDYDSNDGSGSVQNREVYVGWMVTVGACKFERTGYTFTEWNTQPDGTGTAYRPEDWVADLAAAGEHCVLYAQWVEAPIPQTGDENRPLLLAGLAFASAAGCVLMGRRRRRAR